MRKPRDAWILDCVADAAPRETGALGSDSQAATSPDKTGWMPTPHFAIEKELPDVEMVSFVSKEDSAIRHSRPKIRKQARTDSFSQISIANDKRNLLVERRQCVFKVAL